LHNYELEIKENWDPSCTGSALPLVYVGRTTSISANELIRILKAVPIENHDVEFNGQQWIWGALKTLTSSGFLTKKQRDESFNQMLETVLEGSSDEVPEPHHGHVCSNSSNDTTDF
jgi:hypothetical protein